jgi:signal transduction histidine kinase
MPLRGTGASLDGIRMEQFLDMQRELLLGAGDPEGLPGRLVQRLALFLGAAGAVIGVLQEGRYRLLATYGVGPEYARRYDGLALADSELAPALAGPRPLVLDDLDGGAPVKTIILPFRLTDGRGALHIVVPEHAVPADDNLHLARALAGLAGIALANARQCRRLAEMARVKSTALTAMAHDLRAPLNALVGYASLLGEGAFGPLSSEQRNVSATLERQAVELVDLLGATLDIARMETGQLPLRCEDFTLSSVLAALESGTFARARDDGLLGVHLPPDLPVLHGDRVKVKEILQNLIDNALKHSRGGPVTVDVTLGPDRQTVRLAVSDTGPGIPTELLPHLFEPARPGGPTAGTGFGLYIVRCFTEALGGHITTHTVQNQGTTVTVELPVTIAA